MLRHTCLVKHERHFSLQGTHDIVFTAGENPGFFNVTGSTGNEYQVSLDEPSCSCYDWHFYHWPCKHMLAIITSDSACWSDMPQRYRENEFITLDVPDNYDSIDSNSVPDSCNSTEIQNNSTEVLEDQIQNNSTEVLEDQRCHNSHTLFEPSISSGMTRALCQKLERIKALIYEQSSPSVLQEIEGLLSRVQGKLEENRLFSKEGLPLFPKTPKKHKRNKRKLMTIPVPRKKRRTARKSFGIGMLRYYNVFCIFNSHYSLDIC